MDKLTIGEKVIIARKRKGWKQIQLAKRACVSVSTIRRIEQGNSNATEQVLERIFNVLGL